MAPSKAHRDASAQFDSMKAYSVREALELLVKTSFTKFDGTAELHFNLGINPKHADQQIRTTVTLPHGTGKKIRVIVICEDEKVKAAKDAGAIEAGSADLIEKISKGWMDFDKVISTPTMMRSLAKIARILGPRGLMPNPKAGTVTNDIEKTIKEVMGGRIEFRNDKAGLVHSMFGKVSFGVDKLEENFNAFFTAIKNAKPTGQKGDYIKLLTINATMGPGIKVEVV
jgi:large subunit ribosomal protein L1